MIYWIILSFIIVIILAAYFSNKKIDRSIDEVRNILKSYANGLPMDDEWDDFICCPIRNSYLDKIRKQCLIINEEYGTSKENENCNEKGKEILLNYILELNKEISKRKIVAEIATQYYNGEISFEEFFEKLPDSEDEEIFNLTDMITHEPKVVGTFGVSEKDYENFRNELKKQIDHLSSKAT